MIEITPIGYVRSARLEVFDDDWDSITSCVELAPEVPADALLGLEAFSHVEVLFHFDRVPLEKIEWGARHPRNNPDWPKVGIFAQRGKNRPNRLGVCIARLVQKQDRSLVVQGLDAVDGTPVVDLKPVMTEFLPRGEVIQPLWSKELMRGYWRKSQE